MIGAFITVGFVGIPMMLGVGSFLVSVLLDLPLTIAITAGYSALTNWIVFQPLRQSSA
jgi:branched-subunit amino acid ABC-type transport system permease component